MGNRSESSASKLSSTPDSPDSSAIEENEEGYVYQSQPSHAFDDWIIKTARTPIEEVENFAIKASRKKAAWDRLQESGLNFRENQQVQILKLSHAVKSLIQDDQTDREENYQALHQQYDSANLLLAQAVSAVLGNKSALEEALEKEVELGKLIVLRENYRVPESVVQEEDEDVISVTSELSEGSQDLGFTIEGSSESSTYSTTDESSSPIKKVKNDRPQSRLPDRGLEDLEDQIESAENALENIQRSAKEEIQIVSQEYKADFQTLVQALNVAKWTILHGQNLKEAATLYKEIRTQLPFLDLDLDEYCVVIRDKLMDGFGKKEAQFFEGQNNVPNLAIEALVRNAVQEEAIKKYLKLEVKVLCEEAEKLKDMGGKQSWSAILKTMPRDETACGAIFSNITNARESYRIIDETFASENAAAFKELFSEIDGRLKEARVAVQYAMMPLKQNQEFEDRKQNLIEAFEKAKQKYLEAVAMGARPDVKPENLNLKNRSYEVGGENEYGDKTLRYTSTVAQSLKNVFFNSFEAGSVVEASLSSQLVKSHEDRIQLADELAGGIIKAIDAIDNSIRIVRKDAEEKKAKAEREKRDIENRKERLVENLKYVKSRLDDAVLNSARPDLRGISDGEEIESKVMANTFSTEYDLKKFLDEAFASLDLESESYKKKQDLALRIQTKIAKALDVIESSIEAVNEVQPQPAISPVKSLVEKKVVVIATPKKEPATPVVNTAKKDEERSIIEENDAVLNFIITPMKRAAEQMQRITTKKSGIRQPDFGEFVRSSGLEIIDEDEGKEAFYNQVDEIFASVAADKVSDSPEDKMRRALQALAERKASDPKKFKTFLRQVQPFILQFNDHLTIQEQRLDDESRELQQLEANNVLDIDSLAQDLQRVAEDLNLLRDHQDFETLKNEVIGEIVINQAEETAAGVDEEDRQDFKVAAMVLFSDPEVENGSDPKISTDKALQSLDKPKNSNLERARRRHRFLQYLKPLTTKFADELDEAVETNLIVVNDLKNTAQFAFDGEDLYRFTSSASEDLSENNSQVGKKLLFGNSPSPFSNTLPPRFGSMTRSMSLPKGIAADLSPVKSEILDENVDAAIDEVADILKGSRSTIMRLKPEIRRIVINTITAGNKSSKAHQLFEGLDNDYPNVDVEINKRASEILSESNQVNESLVLQVRAVAKAVEELSKELPQEETKKATVTSRVNVPLLPLKKQQDRKPVYESESDEEGPQRRSITVNEGSLTDPSRLTESEDKSRRNDAVSSQSVISASLVRNTLDCVNWAREVLMQLSPKERTRITKKVTKSFKPDYNSGHSDLEESMEVDFEKNDKLHKIFHKLGEDDSKHESRINKAFKQYSTSPEKAQDFLEIVEEVALEIERRARKELSRTQSSDVKMEFSQTEVSSISFLSESPSSSVSRRDHKQFDITWIKKGLKLLNDNTNANLSGANEWYNTHKFKRALNLVSALGEELRDKIWDLQGETKEQVKREIFGVIQSEVTAADKSILTRFLLGEERWHEIFDNNLNLTTKDLNLIKEKLDQLVAVVPEDAMERIHFFHEHALEERAVKDPERGLVQQKVANPNKPHLIGIEKKRGGFSVHQLVTMTEKSRSH